MWGELVICQLLEAVERANAHDRREEYVENHYRKALAYLDELEMSETVREELVELAGYIRHGQVGTRKPLSVLGESPSGPPG